MKTSTSKGISYCILAINMSASLDYGMCFMPFEAEVTTGEVDIGTSTLMPVNQEPALTCLNRTRRAHWCRLATPAGTNVPPPNGQQRSHNGQKPS